jgi:WD40 repeat protein
LLSLSLQLHLVFIDQRVQTADFHKSRRTIPTTSMAVIVSAGTSLNFWKLDGSLLREISGFPRKVDGVVFSPDQQLMLISEYGGPVWLYHSSGERIRNFENFSRVAKFSKDSSMVLTSDLNLPRVQIWDRNGAHLQSLETAPNVLDADFMDDSSTIVIKSFSNATVWKQ